MSRFDRRLKGTGLRPGQSTCKIGKERSGSSPNIGQYATMSWTGNMVTGNPAPTYNPNINARQRSNVVSNSVIQSQPVVSAQVQPNMIQNYNNNVPTVRVMDNDRLDMETRMRDLDELAVKNARLEEAEKTAPNQQMRLITRHEIRLNTLETMTLRMEHLEQIQNGCARMNSLDDRMIEDLKNDLWVQLKSRHDVEVQKVVMGLQDEVVDLKMKIENLQGKLAFPKKGPIDESTFKLADEEEPVVKKGNSITLNIEEKEEGGQTNEDDIKSVVAQAIAKVEAGEA
jgi:hypothetical protein